MANTPADVANRALDMIGSETTIGDLEEGSREAQVCLRAYGECLRGLLRGANWDFARKTATLQLLADATGQTSGAGSIVPAPWIYEYAYPTDCLKVRFIPWNPSTLYPGQPPGNISLGVTPLMTNLGQPPLTGQRLQPARFTIATDFNYIPAQASVDLATPGVSPTGRTVILTNVQNAQCVYTALVLYPQLWDSLFREAFIAYLASEIAMPLTKDKPLALRLRNEQIKIAKSKLMDARVADGREGWYSSDIRVDWMRVRNSGGGHSNTAWQGGAEGAGPNVAWDSVGFSDGSAY